MLRKKKKKTNSMGTSSEYYNEPPSFKEMVVWFIFLAAIFLILMLNNAILPKKDPVVIHVDKFSVSNFSIIDTIVDGVWDADVSFANQYKDVEIQIPAFKSHLYKEANDLACANVEVIELAPRTNKTVRIRFRVKGCGEQRHVEEEVIEMMISERKSGTVRFVMGMMNMEVKTSFRRERLKTWGQGTTGRVICPNLRVGFVSGNADGKLIAEHVTCIESFQ